MKETNIINIMSRVVDKRVHRELPIMDSIVYLCDTGCVRICLDAYDDCDCCMRHWVSVMSTGYMVSVTDVRVTRCR